MKRSHRTLLAVAAVAAIAGCTETQVTWQDNGVPYFETVGVNQWHYQFVYYPNSQVYFQPYTKTFYWFAHGVWYTGTNVPRELSPLDDRTARIVKLRDFDPAFQHESVVAANPPSCFTWAPGFDAREAMLGELRVVGADGEVVESNK